MAPQPHPGPSQLKPQKNSQNVNTPVRYQPPSSGMAAKLQPGSPGINARPEGGSGEGRTTSPNYPRSPERVDCIASWHAVEQTVGAPRQGDREVEQTSPVQICRQLRIEQATKSLEKVQFSETSRELPQLLQSALAPHSTSAGKSLFGGSSMGAA